MQRRTGCQYLYEHWRPDFNIPFYVGIGIEGRPEDIVKRNRFHHAFVEELSWYSLKPIIKIIGQVETRAEANLWEIGRIAELRAAGVVLANISGGGSGILNPTDDLRKRLGEISSSRVRTPEWRARIAASVTNPSAETIAKRVAKLTGYKRSPEFCENVSKGKKNPSLETREHHRQAALRSWQNQEWRTNQSKVRMGQIRITDGIRNEYAKSENDIPPGWRRGMTKRRGWHKRKTLRQLDTTTTPVCN